MRIVVNGRNIEITEAIKAYTKEKIGKAANHYDQIQLAEVVLNVTKNPSVAANHTAEVICKLNNGTLKLEETAETMYAAIDLLADKLVRQINKYKDKYVKADKSDSIRTSSLNESGSEE